MVLKPRKSTKETNKYKLLETFSIELEDYLKNPSEEYQVELLLKNLCHNLKIMDDFSFYLKEGYMFNTKSKILYNKEKKEIKLTKNERKFMEIMSSRKEQYCSSTFIEYSIWDEASLCQDCNQRLKSLLYGLRKKLPHNSIINSYKLGYKLVCEESLNN